MTTPRRELIEAGAGCGKTHGLVSRYLEAFGLDINKNLFRRNQRPFSSVLAVTFTVDAAAEMAERVEKRLSELGQQNLIPEFRRESHIQTLHGLCYRLVLNYLDSINVQDGTLLDPNLSRFVKAERSLKALLSDSSRGTLLKLIDARKIAELSAQFWNSSNRTSASSMHAQLNEKATTLHALLKRLKQRISELPVEEPAAGKRSWIFDFKTLLETNADDFSSLAFNNSPKWRTTEPELYQAAQALQGLSKKGLIKALNKNAIDLECHAYDELFSFFNRAKTGDVIIDFSSLEELTQDYLASHPESIPTFDLILVDEFQDTNKRQFSIVKQLSKEHTEWYLVGDPKQSIYAFRGGDVGLFLELRNSLELARLDVCRRSTPNLLSFINACTRSMFPETPNGTLEPPRQELIAFRSTTVDDQVKLFLGDTRQQFSDLVEQVQQQRKGNPQASIAVLAASWRELDLAFQALRGAGIPCAVSRGTQIFDHILSDLFCEFLVLGEDTAFHDRPKKILSRWIPKETSALTLQQFIDGASECLKNNRGLCEYLYMFSNIIDVVRFPLGPQWLEAAFSFCCGVDAAFIDSSKHGFSAAKLFRSSTKDMAVELSEGSTSEAGCVELTTIHGSKGLEWTHVHLFIKPQTGSGRNGSGFEFEEQNALSIEFDDANGGSVPSFFFEKLKAERKSVLEAEKRRLLYVALTRAKDSLSMYFSKPKTTPRDDKLDPWHVFGLTQVARLNAPAFLLSVAQNSQHVQIFDRHEATDEASKTPVMPGAEPLWTLPSEDAQNLVSRIREGVSAFLERESTIGDDTQSTNNPQKSRSETTQLGISLHRILEIWDGQESTLDQLVSKERHKHILFTAISALKGLPELRTYWHALKTNPDQVFREIPITVLFEGHLLNGFIDALVATPSEIWVIDWKSTGDLARLKRPEKLKKIETQLRIYATSFALMNRPIRLTAFGVSIGTDSIEDSRDNAQLTNQAICLFDKTL